MPSHPHVYGLFAAALVAAWFWMLARRRYRCPLCGRIVRYKDETCPHCDGDMKGRHRAGPEALPRAAQNISRTPRR